MNDDGIKEWYLQLSDSDKLIFLPLVMASLTIHGRAFSLDLPEDGQIRAFIGLNELQHQISNHSVGIGMKSDRYPEDTFLQILKEKALSYGLAVHLSQSLRWARERAYWEQ